MNIIEYENYHERIEQGRSWFPYITSPCSIPLDFSKVPLHWHVEMEIIYIKKGRGMVTLDYVPYHVSGGDILIILPGRLHAIGQADKNSMEYENIIFQPSMLLPRQADVCATEYFLPLLQNQITCPEYLTPSCPYYQEASACLDQADFLCHHRPPAYQLSVKAQLLQFFFLLFTHAADGPACAAASANFSANAPAGISTASSANVPAASLGNAPAASSANVFTTSSAKALPGNQHKQNMAKTKLILKYIENHYPEDLTIKKMAEVCSFSPSHFMKFFKLTFGTSFITYLKEYRLIMASRLLLSSEASVLEIAENTGFQNLSYFNRSFKAMYGKTPREFRKNCMAGSFV